MGVFAKVERELYAVTLSQPQVAAAAGAFMGGPKAHDPTAFGALSRLEQQAIITSGNPVAGNIALEFGVKATLGMENMPGRIEIKFGGRAAAYLATTKEGVETGIVPLIERSQKILRLSNQETGALLGSSRTELENRLDLIQPATMLKGEARKIEMAKNAMRRGSFLYGGLEPSRREGVPTTTAIATSLAHSGELKPRELLLTEGAMSGRGAASRDPKNPFYGSARAETERKVYRIMNRLKAASAGTIIVTTPGGFNVENFAAAVDLLLTEIVHGSKGRVIDEIGLMLEAELRIFLQKYHGR